MPDVPSIALDVSFLGSIGGFGRYTEGLLHALLRANPAYHFILVRNALPPGVPQYEEAEERFRRELPNAAPNWNLRESRSFNRLWWCQAVLPRLLKRERAGLFHAFDGMSVPFLGYAGKKVLTLHDIIPLTHPEYARRRDALAARFFMPKVIAASDRIITASRYSAEQILERFPHVASQLHVIPYGVDVARFYPAEDRSQLARELAQEGSFYSSRFFLAVATLSPRRNLVRLLQAFASFIEHTSSEELCLLVAGCRGWKDGEVFDALHALPCAHRVHFLGRVSDLHLLRLNQAALALVHPSLLEGFGFPLVESMACATPVLCSNSTSLAEVAGEAALMFDPLNVEEISQAMKKIAEDASLWQSLSTRGLARSRQYSWDTTAAQVLQVYHELLGEDV